MKKPDGEKMEEEKERQEVKGRQELQLQTQALTGAAQALGLFTPRLPPSRATTPASNAPTIGVTGHYNASGGVHNIHPSCHSWPIHLLRGTASHCVTALSSLSALCNARPSL